VGNTLIPVVLFEGKDPARASNFGNAFFGLGYVSLPFLFTFFLQQMGMSYSASLSVFAVLVLVFLFFALAARFPEGAIGFEFSKAVSLLGKAPVLIAAAALFCYISLEVSLGTWIRSLMEELWADLEPASAAYRAGMVLSLFGAAMMVGRFASAAVKDLTAIGPKVIAGSAALSLVAIILMIVAKSPALAIVAVVLAGLAFAPVFPTIVGVTFAKFDASLYGSIFGIIFAIGLLGGTFVPMIIGNLSVGSSVQESLSIAAGMAAILLVVSFFIGKVGKPGASE
jgi:fucose permease